MSARKVEAFRLCCTNYESYTMQGKEMMIVSIPELPTTIAGATSNLRPLCDFEAGSAEIRFWINDFGLDSCTCFRQQMSTTWLLGTSIKRDEDTASQESSWAGRLKGPDRLGQT